MNQQDLHDESVLVKLICPATQETQTCDSFIPHAFCRNQELCSPTATTENKGVAKKANLRKSVAQFIHGIGSKRICTVVICNRLAVSMVNEEMESWA